jgi:hypothetical protein
MMDVHHKIALDHLDRMTDSTGLIQHAIYSIPRRESGYTTDDNARALRLCVHLWSHRSESGMLNRVTKYLSFLEHARGVGRGFHNFLSYDRNWLDAEGCGDCQGQAIRALADVLGSNLPDGYRALARELIEEILPTLADLRSLRAQAYTILACGHLQSVGTPDIEPLTGVAWSAARRLADCYRHAQRPGWQWFESRMTYANAVLPHALFVAAEHWPTDGFLDVAKDSFAFLNRHTTMEGDADGDGRILGERLEGRFTPMMPLYFSGCESFFWPVGNEGWFPHGEEKALYDQQPVEAVTMAEAAQAAYRLLGDEQYMAAFRRAHAWFHGRNSLGEPLANMSSGACCDGLLASGVNQNQGAESTLAFLWTELCNFELLPAADAPREEIASRGT